MTKTFMKFKILVHRNFQTAPYIRPPVSPTLYSANIYTNTKSESFVVDMERISHLVEKDMNANSRITRNLSRKGLLKKTNFNAVNEKDTSLMATSPRASLLGASMPEKPMVVTAGTTDHSTLHTHNQNTTVAASNGAAATSGATAIDSKGVSRRFSFRRSASPSWTVDPRRILIFFATISSVGTIVLIYFTLSIQWRR
ncbi:uncharacterized protein LOC132053449 isoform X2 [Lycium ferocissimum]|uniref:uncharacterized protein LOC132053449 isoform X2 n=1 Tax=Lycium ferocissimum TaxID=112874 RepID=UPI00281621B4|nr:uncharacterized protein LOC132053449 isoform X2 [Lycium ferocissimum]